jgi:hypothetical protein
MQSFSTEGGNATVKLTATAARSPWFRLPWRACLGGTEWQIHLNPSVSSEITAHTGGGNVNLGLADMALTSVSAETGGGNMDMILPEHAAELRVKARTGGGNISIELGDAMASTNTVEAISGAGNVVVEVPVTGPSVAPQAPQRAVRCESPAASVCPCACPELCTLLSRIRPSFRMCRCAPSNDAGVLPPP